MNYLVLFIGITLYIMIVTDMVMTTVTVKGGGWITNKISSMSWKFFLKLCDHNGKSRLLSHIGYLQLLFIVLFWVVMLNVSFTLVLWSDTASVINSTSKLPVNLWGKIYYSGFSLSTLGVGDYIAKNDLWRLVTTLYSFTGLILITMSITYFIPVLNAVIKKRKLGILISSLGKEPQDMVLNSYNKEKWDVLNYRVVSLAEELIEHSQNHRAYPVIHYFHNNKKEKAIIIQIARLNEAIFILKNFIKIDVSSESNPLDNIDIALSDYIEVIQEVKGVKFTEVFPSNPGLNKLEDAGLIQKNTKSTNKLTKEMQKRRKVLCRLVKEDGWEWKDIIKPSI
ncbi:Ion channel [Salegentibacter echinorum]|uniref:Ion channel n=1 Tax=Salegentibacter echinorum TaxID=1073325 RepID=A0A1M5BJV7_SALEC|nr:potassium channel family protein [Salegentibacter echinorum]SHF42874.1 Ion channel [Salegentibacter echinorum]